MAATVYTGKNENFLYTNNSGGNARIIINGCYIAKDNTFGGNPGVIQWGDFLDSNRGTSGLTANPNNPFKSFDFLSDGLWGRNTRISDLTYLYTVGGGPDNTSSIPSTAFGVPCEYYIADGERFSLYHKDTDRPEDGSYGSNTGVLWYNIVVITDTAGTVENGQGDFNYTNNTGEAVRVIMAFLNHDTGKGVTKAPTHQMRAQIYWGSSTDTQAGSNVSTRTQTGMGKWCIYNNTLNSMGEYITGDGRFNGPNEFWLAPGDYLSVTTQGYGHNSGYDDSYIGSYSYLILPSSGS